MRARHVFALLSLASACTKETRPESTPAASPTPISAMPTPPPPTPSAPDAAATPDANLASYELSGHIVRLTREDGMAIRAALLAEIAKSQVEHRELLLARTRDAAIEIEHGQMRIGSWWLQGRGDELYLMQRMGPHPVALFYGANVRNEAGRWRISSFGPGEIRWQH